FRVVRVDPLRGLPAFRLVESAHEIECTTWISERRLVRDGLTGLLRRLLDEPGTHVLAVPDPLGGVLDALEHLIHADRVLATVDRAVVPDGAHVIAHVRVVRQEPLLGLRGRRGELVRQQSLVHVKVGPLLHLAGAVHVEAARDGLAPGLRELLLEADAVRVRLVEVLRDPRPTLEVHDRETGRVGRGDQDPVDGAPDLLTAQFERQAQFDAGLAVVSDPDLPGGVLEPVAPVLHPGRDVGDHVRLVEPVRVLPRLPPGDPDVLLRLQAVAALQGPLDLLVEGPFRDEVRVPLPLLRGGRVQRHDADVGLVQGLGDAVHDRPCKGRHAGLLGLAEVTSQDPLDAALVDGAYLAMTESHFAPFARACALLYDTYVTVPWLGFEHRPPGRCSGEQLPRVRCSTHLLTPYGRV